MKKNILFFCLKKIYILFSVILVFYFPLDKTIFVNVVEEDSLVLFEVPSDSYSLSLLF